MTPYEDPGKHLLSNNPNHLEALFAIDFPDRWQNEMCIVLEHQGAEAQANTMLLSICRVFFGIKSVVGHSSLYWISVETQDLLAAAAQD